MTVCEHLSDAISMENMSAGKSDTCLVFECSCEADSAKLFFVRVDEIVSMLALRF